MAIKWMNCGAGTTNYPAREANIGIGTGGRSAASVDSGFANIASAANGGGSWDDLRCVLYGVLVNPGTALGTVTITNHAGTVGVGPSVITAGFAAAAGTNSFYVELLGIELDGLKVVTVGAGMTCTVFYEIGQQGSYSAT